MASLRALGPKALALAEALGFSIRLNTAAGPSSVNKTIKMRIKALGERIKPFLLPDTPFVMSIGLRCMELGYSFIWWRYQKPYFILPDGGMLELESHASISATWGQCPLRRAGGGGCME